MHGSSTIRPCGPKASLTKGLLSAAIAISRDVALSDGDAISPSTRRLLADTSGGTILTSCVCSRWCVCNRLFHPPVLPEYGPQRATDPFTTTVSIRAKMCGFCASRCDLGQRHCRNFQHHRVAKRERAQRLCAQCLVALLCSDCPLVMSVAVVCGSGCVWGCARC